MDEDAVYVNAPDAIFYDNNVKRDDTEVCAYPDINVLKKFVIDKDVDIILIWSKETEEADCVF